MSEQATTTNPRASDGSTVRVHYTGKLEDGTVFDSSEGRDPLEFTIGAGEVIPGFERAVDGMSVGESRAARIEVDDAYGPRREDLLMEIEKEQIPEDIDVEVGSRLQLTNQDGRAVPVTVTEVGDATVTLDANHPLAGEDLQFELELVSVA